MNQPKTSTVAIAAAFQRKAFNPKGPLAISANALGAEYEQISAPPSTVQAQSVAVVEVTGPLMHHPDFWFDSYDGIKERVKEALASTASCVLLSVDSPGGLVAGCFDTVREIRTMVAAAGKPLYAYLDANACSGGYALLCAASKVFVPPSGIGGSIGVISDIIDATAQDAQWGEKHTIIKSGARKADTNPHVEITPDGIAAEQRVVDRLAEQFFALVSECRGISVENVAALEAGVLVGAELVAAGLADQVATFDQVVAMLVAPAVETAPDEGNSGGTQVTYEEIVGALKGMAEGEDEEQKAKAKAALAAMEGEPDGDEPEEEKKEEAKAESEEPHKEPDGDEEKPEASRTNLSLAATVQQLSAWKRQKEEQEERAKLMASRPDFAPEVVSFLDKQSLSTVRDACRPASKGGLPLGSGKGGAVAASRAAITVDHTVGDGCHDAQSTASRGVSDQSGHGAKLDELMGIAPFKNPVVLEGNIQKLGVMTPEQARQVLKSGGAA